MRVLLYHKVGERGCFPFLAQRHFVAAGRERAVNPPSPYGISSARILGSAKIFPPSPLGIPPRCCYTRKKLRAEGPTSRQR